MAIEDVFVPLPISLKPLRDRLRLIDKDLVRNSSATANYHARFFRHSPEDYEYAIYRIFWIDPKSGQIYIKDDTSHYTSFAAIENWVKHYEAEKYTAWWAIFNNGPDREKRERKRLVKLLEDPIHWGKLRTPADP